MLSDPPSRDGLALEDRQQEIDSAKETAEDHHESDDPDMPFVYGDSMQEHADGELEEYCGRDIEELAEPPVYQRSLCAVRFQVFEVSAGTVHDSSGLANEVCGEGRLEEHEIRSHEKRTMLIGKLTTAPVINQSSIPHVRKMNPLTYIRRLNVNNVKTMKAMPAPSNSGPRSSIARAAPQGLQLISREGNQRRAL